MKGKSWLKVTLRMQNHIINGFTNLYADERLLDVLNGVSTRRPKSRERALELTDAVIIRPNGQEENKPTLYVNKLSICLAATWEKDGGRGVLSKMGRREYPFAEKLAVPVYVELPLFSLSGNMHLARSQMVGHLLDERLSFLPMTNVKVQPLMNGLWSNVAFVAVNREQILSLQHGDIPLLNLKPSKDLISHN